MRKYWLISAIFLGLMSASPLYARDNGKDSPAKAQPVLVTVAPVINQAVPVTVKAIGTVVPFQTVALSARIDSQIMAIKFNAGDFVKTGQPLFILDDRALKAQLAQAQAALDANRAQIDNLKKQYDRQALGAEKGFSSEAARDAARADLEERKALVASGQAAVEAIKVQLGYTVIVSPIDGRTGTINFTVGNTVKANDANPLVIINQISPVSVQAALPQASFDTVRAAMSKGPIPVTATRDGSNTVLDGALAYIDNAIVPASGTFNVRASFPNKDERLWPGMLANVTVTVDRGTESLTVPDVAVQTDSSGSFVYTVENGKAVQKKITVSRIQDRRALIDSGLKVGDIVAVDGMMSLKDGAPVKTSPGGSAP